MLVKILPRPGMVKTDSAYISEGRYIDGDKVRFVSGLPEKLGGWAEAIDETLSGVARGIVAWRDADGIRRVGIGTHTKLYETSFSSLTNITPFRSLTTGTLTNPLDTNGTTTVTVNDTAHGLTTGDQVYIKNGTTIDGLDLNGWFMVTVSDADTYTITSPTAASGSTTGGGGTVNYEYPRTSLSGPFTTVNGSTTVTVAHTAHGARAGDTVYFSGASAVGGITLDGAYTISNVTTNAYEVTHSAAATSSTSGGGTVSTRYEINTGRQDTIISYGYGVGTYGTGTYGTARSTGFALGCRVWSLAKYGTKLLASPVDGTIYEYDPAVGGRATPLVNAPSTVKWMLVNDDTRFVFALGADDDLTVKWPDQDDINDWTASATDTANSRKVQGGNAFVGGLSLPQRQVLASTDTTCYIFQYTGSNEVFSTRSVGSRSGFFGPNAGVLMGGLAYWMSDGDFWVYDGAAPRRLDSEDIRAFVFEGINRDQRAKCFAGANSKFNEVWWFYPSSGSSEIDRYVIYNAADGTWSAGTLDRTCWLDRDVYENPIATDTDGAIYYHEMGVDADGAAMDSSIVMAPMDLGDGDMSMDIMGVIPDFKNQVGTVEFTLLTRIYPNDADTEDGPYDLDTDTGRLDVRAHGRMVGFKLRSNEISGDWRLGANRVDAFPAGMRP